jgi:hypothetical protein
MVCPRVDKKAAFNLGLVQINNLWFVLKHSGSNINFLRFISSFDHSNWIKMHLIEAWLS